MTNVSRPLLVLLVGVIAFFGVWTVALKPKPSSNSTPSPAATAPAATAPAATAPAATAPTAAARAAPSEKPPIQRPALAAPRRLDIVDAALDAHKVVALLFYNPLAADDRALKQELAAVPVHGRQVVKLAVPLNELARYPVVSYHVPVTESPTLVQIDRREQASEIVGFADRFEIAGRVADALAAK